MPPREPIREAALLAVTCRAHETQRLDRVLEDPLASHLVTGRSEALFAEEIDGIAPLVIVVSTAAVDSALRRVVKAHNIHTIAALGGGLDTRPYRLELPSDLRWVEADLAAVLDYKVLRLAHVAPYCRVRRVSVDLSDPAARGLALHKIARDVTRGLVLTEWLASALALDVLDDLIERMPAVFDNWLIDTATTPLKWWSDTRGGSHHAPLVSPEHVLDAFDRHHWRAVDFRSVKDQVLRLVEDRAVGPIEGYSPGEYEGVWRFQRTG